MPLESEAADTPDVPEDPAPAIGRRKARREAEEQQQAEPLSGSDPLDTTGSIGVGSDGSADTGGHILAGPHDPGWGSADVGWQAAEALVAQTRQTQETTAAGLPKRVPKSNLVPGSAAPRSQSPAPVKPAAPRSADAVRGRMSNCLLYTSDAADE